MSFIIVWFEKTCNYIISYCFIWEDMSKTLASCFITGSKPAACGLVLSSVSRCLEPVMNRSTRPRFDILLITLYIQFLSAQHEHNKRLQSIYAVLDVKYFLIHFHRWGHSLQVTPKISITTTPSTWTLLHIRKIETMITDAAWKILDQWVLAI